MKNLKASEFTLQEVIDYAIQDCNFELNAKQIKEMILDDFADGEENIILSKADINEYFNLFSEQEQTWEGFKEINEDYNEFGYYKSYYIVRELMTKYKLDIIVISY